MSKFTPGPWQINGSHIYTADPERALLAQVFNPGERVSDYPLVENARLIAAAPELYEALERIVENNNTISVIQYDDRLRARAALAKARGEV